jgi:hypothetical protein
MRGTRSRKLFSVLRHTGWLLVLVMTASFMVAQPVFAADAATAKKGAPPPIDAAQRRHLALQGIYKIDNPCPANDGSATDTSGNTTGTGGKGTGENVDNYPHIKLAWQFFLSRGWSPAQSAGIVGNLMQESGWRIDPTDTDGVAHGIAQWQGGRLQPMWSWVAAWASDPNNADLMKKNGDLPGKNSFTGQLNYIEHDLLHDHNSVAKIIKADGDPVEAANDWNKYYEVSADKTTKRGDNATAVYNAAINERWSEGVIINQDPIDAGGGSTSSDTGSGNACGDDTVGGVDGSSCGDIGEKSDNKDPKDPYQCNNTQVKCAVGKDDGTHWGYADGKPYHIRICVVDGVRVNAFVAVNIDKMIKAAAADGVKLTGDGGGFREMKDQIAIRPKNGCPTDHIGSPNAQGFYDQATLIKNKNDTSPTSRCRTPAAPPGFSNHQMGMAVDWHANGPLIGSHDNAGYKWLKANASKFGFYNFPQEAWHWSVDGA